MIKNQSDCPQLKIPVKVSYDSEVHLAGYYYVIQRWYSTIMLVTFNKSLFHPNQEIKKIECKNRIVAIWKLKSLHGSINYGLK